MSLFKQFLVEQDGWIECDPFRPCDCHRGPSPFGFVLFIGVLLVIAYVMGGKA